MVKRVFDLTLGCFLFVILSPLWIGLCLIIVLESPGFPFYISTRIGRSGQKFSMIKFRSMIHDAESMK